MLQRILKWISWSGFFEAANIRSGCCNKTNKKTIPTYPEWTKIKPTIYSSYVANSDSDKNTYEYHTMMNDEHYILVLLGGDTTNKYNDPWLVCRARPSKQSLKDINDVKATYYTSKIMNFSDDSFAYNILMKFSPYDQITINDLLTRLDDYLMESML